MATIKLKKPAQPGRPSERDPARPPVRGVGAGARKPRPTLAEAEAQRAEREARYQEQLRQRFGERPPEKFVRRDDTARSGPAARRHSDAPTRHEGPGTPPPRHGRDDRRPPARRSAPPLPQGPRPAGRNTAFGRDDAPAPARRRAPDPRDEDEVVIHPELPGSMRLSKRMSELGLASRREADEWIPKGWVRVDGRVVTELGSRVLPEQQITIDAKARHMQAQRVTILIHKPVGYVSGQAEDGYEPAYVLVTPENQWREDRSGIRFLRSHLRNLAPAGRLDIDSTGLLVLTQDGRIAKQLIGDDSEIDKEYLVRVKSRNGEPLSQESLALLNHGLALDGVQLRPALVEWVNDDQLRFVLREGRKRQIRRMCEAVGLDVLGLKRVRIGKVMLGDLPPGQWRYLKQDF